MVVDLCLEARGEADMGVGEKAAIVGGLGSCVARGEEVPLSEELYVDDGDMDAIQGVSRQRFNFSRFVG